MKEASEWCKRKKFRKKNELAVKAISLITILQYTGMLDWPSNCLWQQRWVFVATEWIKKSCRCGYWKNAFWQSPNHKNYWEVKWRYQISCWYIVPSLWRLLQPETTVHLEQWKFQIICRKMEVIHSSRINKRIFLNLMSEKKEQRRYETAKCEKF